MRATEIIEWNISETRRRSIKLWNAIPEDHLFWKPDEKAFTVIESICHVLEGEHLFHKIVENRGNLGNYISPWSGLEFSTVQDELDFAEPYHKDFLSDVRSFSSGDLSDIIIERKEVGQSKKLSDYLNRIVYHEAVHTGQLLNYLRQAGISRPNIWD